ncbi:serine/threonine-protein kinase [Archangium lipolyticum]|uniref:serine/threonine-protein kinase n=1 Tax=Archangium lipolyticum TaxID=2970465 RepID=UPI002149E2EB|nr:serine/threonine-protein kinase [Archangium lipolyticum]
MTLEGTRIGPYRLKHLVGSGGMGQVFAAVNERIEQEVALKLLSPEAARDPQLVARFLQEGRALARLQHPGVVRIHHCDQRDDGTVYLAMELLQGLSLREWMRSHPGPAPRDEALAIGRRIAEVMTDIHTKGIVHRDLKPENVFLCSDTSLAPEHRLKLLDFGIAKVPPAVSGNLVDTQVQTLAPAFLGTARYMAPEQFRNAATVDGAADVYALGVLLFELLAGRPPFDSSDLIEVISMHVQGEPPPLREFAPAIPGMLSTFIASMLAKNPAERPTMLRCQDMLGRSWEEMQDRCPLPGLSPFTEAQAELFFGRRTEIDEVLGLIEESHTGRRRWVQLEGPSGIGKSSLVQAGLLPRLKEQRTGDTPRWLIVNPRPSHAPLRGLALALHATYADEGLARSPEELEAMLLGDPQALRTLVTAHTPPGCCLLLVLEQLEELFTLGETERRHLDGLVSAALAAPDSPLRLLTTLRSDFIHQFEQWPRLAQQLNEAVRHYLRGMDEGALTQVIQGMAQRAGLRLSEGLPERMVRDATSVGSRLSLIGHTLRGLWAQRSGTLLTHERYEQLGGVGGALVRQAEQLLDGLGVEKRERAKWLLLDLVQVNRGSSVIRRSRSRQEVLLAAGGDALAEEVLRQLSGMRSGSVNPEEQAPRLIVVSEEADPSQQRVDLIHETLLQLVPSIAGWIEKERTRLERHAELEASAHTWEQEPGYGLPTGTLLEHYLQTVGSSSPGLAVRKASETAMRFLEAARRLERRRTWIRRAALFASVAAVLAITLSAVQAIRERLLAQATLQEILDLTNGFVSNTDWELSRRSFTLPVRQQLLEKLDERLANLPEQYRDTSEVRLATIETRQRRADLAFHDGTLAQAIAFLDTSLKSLQQGLREQPENTGFLFLLGLEYSKRGKIVQALGHPEARLYFTQAIKLFERQHPKDEPNDRRTRATSYSELADLELATGRPDIAMKLYDRALPLLEKNKNKGVYDQSLLAETLGSRAKAAHLAGAPDAKAFFVRALDLGRSVKNAEPENTYSLWVLAGILVKKAEFEMARGEHGAAAEHYQEAQELGRELHEGEKPNKRYALVLGESLLGEENLAHFRGDCGLATRLRDERCALIVGFRRKDPEDVRFRPLACD